MIYKIGDKAVFRDSIGIHYQIQIFAVDKSHLIGYILQFDGMRGAKCYEKISINKSQIVPYDPFNFIIDYNDDYCI